MGKIDYYNNEERLVSAKKGLMEHPNISSKNKEIILDFEKQLFVLNLSTPRICKYIYLLRIVAEKVKKNFDKLTKEDIVEFVASVNARKDIKEWTKHDYKVILKRFFKWFKGFEGTKEYPEEVKWIRARIAKNKIELPNEGDLLNEEDIKKMIDKARNQRDKAIIAVLWESGARIGEIGTIKIKDVVFDKYGASVNVLGKTGARKIRLISSVPYLAQWLSLHPLKEDRNSFVWVTLQQKPAHLVSHRLISMILRESGFKAGIYKKVNPHSFRHARATFLANHLTEFQMNQYFGWVQGSSMPSTYVHMSGKNTENALLKMNGIVCEEEQKQSMFKPKRCVRCETINIPENKFCSKCGNVIDIIEAAKLQEEQEKQEDKRMTSDNDLNLLLKDPEVISLMVKKLKALEAQKLDITV